MAIDDTLAPPESPPESPPPASPTEPAPRRRRWPKRVLIGLLALVVLAVVVAGGGYLYIRNRLDKIRRVPVTGISAGAVSGPENILLTGSDSRAGQPAGAASHFGSSSLVAGQRSDVVILVHIDPRTSKAAMLSIPRDTLVVLAGTGRHAKINDAFNTGPSELIQTITQNFGITINHYASVDFTGLMNLTDAVGGVCMNFPYPVRDGSPTGYGNESGLDIPTAGPHVLDGNSALAFVRSRYYRYYENGYWHSEGTGDIGRIVRQHEFLRALAGKAVHDAKHNPFTANKLVNHVVNDLTVDSGLSSSDILHLALQFMSLNPAQIPSWTLPYRAVLNYGSFGDVLLPEPGPDQQAIAAWESYGAPAPGTSSGSSTTSTLAPASVRVKVLNGSGVAGQAGRAAAALRAGGFTVISYSTGPSFGHTASVVSYPKGAAAQARTLAGAVRGAVVLRQDPSLTGTDVVLTTGTAFAGVNAPAATTATTAPAAGGGVAPTTDVLPAWDPTPC